MKKHFKHCITLLLLFALITAITPLQNPTPGKPKPPVETQGNNDTPPDKGIKNF